MLLNFRIFAAVVDETKVLGSDGESIEVSPCSSDQCANQFDRHVINVKLRQKPARRWNEVYRCQNEVTVVSFTICSDSKLAICNKFYKLVTL